MIEHYSDHAANERTFLAWVRTAIAVMAFGFIVEKFDIFLDVTAQSLTGHDSPATGKVGGHLVGTTAGLLLILLGGVMLGLAIARFRATAQYIDDPKAHPGSGTRTDIVLATLLVMLGIVLFVYLTYTVVSRF